MTLQRVYKKGTLVKFKWYDNYRDYWDNKENFKIVEGIVDTTCFNGDVIVYNGHEDTTYCVDCRDIIRSF